MSAPTQPTVEKTKEPTPAIADPQQPPQPTTQQPAQPQQAPKKRSRFDNKRYHPSDAVLIVAAILLPPLAVFLKTGCSGALALNILLDLFGWIPGVLHALWIVLSD